MCCLVLGGCASNEKKETKEYTVDEFSEIYWSLEEYAMEKSNNLTQTELFGDSTVEEERYEHAAKIRAVYAKEKLEEWGFSYGETIQIRGRFKRTGSENKYGFSCYFDPIEKNYDILEICVYIKDNGNELESLMEDDVIVFQAEFIEELAGKFPIMGNGKIISK